MTDLRLVMFDCDGTLVDSQHQIIAAMGEAFAAYGQPAPSHADIRQIIGLSLHEAIAALAPDQNEEGQAALVAAYRTSFIRLRETDAIEDPLFPSVQPVLEGLREAGYLLGIATGKARRGLDHVLKKHDLAHLFVTLQTPDVAPGKPHPAMMEQAMADTGVSPENTVLVGDTVFDVEMAGHAGVAAIGVSWGYHAPDALMQAGAHTIIDHFEDLVAVLGRIWEPV